MPNRKKHNQAILNDMPFATSKDARDTDNTNKYMDAPSQRYPGMKHREHRHDPIKVGRRLSGGSESAYRKKTAIATIHTSMDDLDHRVKTLLSKRRKVI